MPRKGPSRCRDAPVVSTAKGCLMWKSSKVIMILVTAWVMAVVSVSLSGPITSVDREAERRQFKEYLDEAMPVVSEMTGIDSTEPVPVVMFTRSEVRNYLVETVEREYPEDELAKRGECLSALGLLPRGYDLEEGLIGLIADEAGAFYDPYTDDLKGIADLPAALKSPTMQKMIVSHELTHALQDRVIDISAIAKTLLDDIAYDFCVRAVIEGMASNVMLAYMHGVPLESAPDVEVTMRTWFDARVSGSGPLSTCPLYLRENLLSPYAEGGGFVERWRKANPDKKMIELLRNIPVSSEQTMHFDKFEEGDEPTPIDLSYLTPHLPSDWEFYYANSLGEFEMLMLFRSHESTKPRADELAAGWDGFRFQTYRDRRGRLVLIGYSVWDTEEDAADFSGGFSAVMEEIYKPDEYRLVQRGEDVGFILGAAGRDVEQMASALRASP